MGNYEGGRYLGTIVHDFLVVLDHGVPSDLPLNGGVDFCFRDNAYNCG